MNNLCSESNPEQITAENSSAIQLNEELQKNNDPANQMNLKKELKIELNKETKGDEYPIIWFEPDIDSDEKKVFKVLIQENSDICLFSKFDEAFDFAQSLSTGFLLIAPNEVDEEKLLQGFEALQDTYGRRYFDFEEEAVLTSLFKQISEDRIKSLKVYVFWAPIDLLKAVLVNKEGEEEEVVVMRDAKEMAEQFREEFRIFWCDPDSCLKSKEALVNKFDIEEKNIYINLEELLKKLENYSDLPYHLILSGQSKIEMIVDKIDDFKDLLCVYVYDGPPLVINGKKARKIKMEKTLEELIPIIIEGVRTNLKYKNTFPAFATQFDGWDKSHINKVHYYLRGFINFKNRRQAKGDFINLAKRIYQSKKLLEFEHEYFEYNKEQILKWYAAQSPIYKLINNCLRISTSDSILYCRFILKDMERAIREEYQQQSKKYNGVVHRGAYISKAEFEKLERNVGKEIEMYGFLSTSKSLHSAEKFLYDDIKNKVLITIIIPPLPSPELDEQGFVDMRNFSEFSQEEEILFNVRSRFQVLEVGSIQVGKNKKECRHLVLLYGAQLLRRYTTMANPMISLKFEFSETSQCNSCKSKENLFAYTEEAGKTQIICRKCFTSNSFVPKSTFLLPIDEKVDLSEKRQIDIEVQGRLLDFGIEAKLAYLKTYKCHNCLKLSEYFYTWINLENKSTIFDCAECFKETQENRRYHLLVAEESTQVFWGSKQGKWEEIEMDWQTTEFERFETDDGADIFEKAHDNGKCQEFCRAILQSSVRKLGRELVKVASYISLGRISTKLGEDQKAIEYHLMALQMWKLIYGESDPQIATSYNNLASAYQSLGEHQKAFEYLLKTLEIEKSIYGESHLNTATSYNNLASVHESLGEHQRALEYLLKALQIKKSLYGESHPNTVASYNNLASVYYKLGEHEKALEYHLKALQMWKLIYGESHPNTATSYNNLGLLYKDLGEHGKALEYFLKALQIWKLIYGEANSNTASSFNNLALVHESLGERQKALEYLLKALEIWKSISGESHPGAATSYNNLASMYYSLGEIQKALEYHLKALEIRKSIYGESHSDTAASYNNLGFVYYSLGEYQKALEYFLKAFEIHKSIYGESDPQIATSYNNLALVYESFGEYQKALEYHLKALEIRKSIYGESHPETVSSYNNVALVYYSLGEHQKAVEYYRKVPKVLESI